MKAIMISVKPKWCAEIMNGKKTIEVRKNKALANAIQKLIDENGFADIYVYCSKGKYEMGKFNSDKKYHEIRDDCSYAGGWLRGLPDETVNGKVVFKFRCYKVDDYVYGSKWSWKTGSPMWGISNGYEYILKDACLTDDELRNYVDDLTFSAIHISNLEIFDKPKELNEFYKGFRRKYHKDNLFQDIHKEKNALVQPIRGGYEYAYPLTKAPQNFCYIIVDE